MLTHFVDLRLREAQIPEPRIAVMGEKACHLSASLCLPCGDHSIEGAFELAGLLPGRAGDGVGSGITAWVLIIISSVFSLIAPRTRR